MDSCDRGCLGIEAGFLKRNFMYRPASLFSSSYQFSSAARECWEIMEKVDLFFKNQFSQSIVTPGRPIRVYLNNPFMKDNAAWCTGPDRPTNNCFHFGTYHECNPMEYNFGIIAHEMTHAVVTMHGDLANSCHAGSLNESIADAFSVMAQHYYAGADADGPDTKWLIGEGIYKARTHNNYIRSLKEPKIGHMSQYMYTDLDAGGIHTNCGIPSKAFYLAAQRTGGKSYEKIGKIWHDAFKSSVYNNDFAWFAHSTMVACRHSGFRSEVYNILGQAWMEVGVNLGRFARLEDHSTSCSVL